MKTFSIIGIVLSTLDLLDHQYEYTSPNSYFLKYGFLVCFLEVSVVVYIKIKIFFLKTKIIIQTQNKHP
jgi:hypothetical protein